MLEPDESVNADITVEMPLSVYEAILRGEMGSTRAFLLGKIKVKGKKLELMKRSKALDKLNNIVRRMIFGGESISAARHIFRRISTF